MYEDVFAHLSHSQQILTILSWEFSMTVTAWAEMLLYCNFM